MSHSVTENLSKINSITTSASDECSRRHLIFLEQIDPVMNTSTNESIFNSGAFTKPAPSY